ncbi:MAG: dethiobiotin synthase [Alphaproteobacteria bacterium]
MKRLFITSSGTGIGKTLVMRLLIEGLRAKGRTIDALKPIISGWGEEPVEETDTGIILTAMGRPLDDTNIADISPWRFAEALSPDMAARREGRAVDFDALIAFCRDRPNDADVQLIEGVGGVLVPLDDRHTVLDWLAALECPAVLVVGSYLGTISHTLTAAHVLRDSGVPLAAVIVSESEEEPVPSAETAATLARFLPGVALHVLPRPLDAETRRTCANDFVDALAL